MDTVFPTSTWAQIAPALRVLVCVDHAGVGELIRLQLEYIGCTVAGMNVMDWLVGKPIPGGRSAVLILDTWPLRHADAASQARARLAAEPVALVLLSDSPQPADLAVQFGAIATLPLLFTLHDLVTAIQQGNEAPVGELGVCQRHIVTTALSTQLARIW